MSYQLTIYDALARRTDPITSRLAARTVDLRLTERHRWILEWLAEAGTATDDELASAAVSAGLVNRHEQGRRLARTTREDHGLLVPALDENGEQLLRRNPSGRYALVWRLA